MSDPSSYSAGPVGRYYIPVHDSAPATHRDGMDSTLVTLLFIVLVLILTLVALFPKAVLATMVLAVLAIGGRVLWCLRTRR